MDIKSLHPADAADQLQRLPVEEARQALLQLSIAYAAAILYAELPEERRTEVMAGLASDEKAKVDTLLIYRPDTAGGIMSDQFISLRTNQTVDECLRLLQGKADESEGGISYLYVTDDA